MRRLLALLLFGLAFQAPAHAGPARASDALIFEVFTDYSIRYICSARFPDLQAKVDEAYYRSPLRRIEIPCDGLKCADPRLEQDLKKFTDEAMLAPENEVRKTCVDYVQQSGREEKRFENELAKIPPGTKFPIYPSKK